MRMLAVLPEFRLQWIRKLKLDVCYLNFQLESSKQSAFNKPLLKVFSKLKPSKRKLFLTLSPTCQSKSPPADLPFCRHFQCVYPASTARHPAVSPAYRHFQRFDHRPAPPRCQERDRPPACHYGDCWNCSNDYLNCKIYPFSRRRTRRWTTVCRSPVRRLLF